MRRPTMLIIALLALSAAAIAGCGGGGGGSATAAAAKRGSVNTRSTSLGTILVDARGRTLYLFEKDRNGRSACSGACAQTWPPAIVRGKATAGSGVSQSRLSTFRRSDGSRQLVYAGQPLYRFIKDAKPGDTTGQGLDAFGAEWYVLNPAGRKIEKKAGRTSAAMPNGY